MADASIYKERLHTMGSICNGRRMQHLALLATHTCHHANHNFLADCSLEQTCSEPPGNVAPSTSHHLSTPQQATAHSQSYSHRLTQPAKGLHPLTHPSTQFCCTQQGAALRPHVLQIMARQWQEVSIAKQCITIHSCCPRHKPTLTLFSWRNAVACG